MSRKNFLKVVQDAIERNKTIILPNENVIPSNIGVTTNKIKHLNLIKKDNVVKYNRVFSATTTPLVLCNRKYKFHFIAPNRTSDKSSYYEMDSVNKVPKGFIRLVFCVRPSDSIADCRMYGVSKDTWESTRSRYVTIFSFKVKEGLEEVQQSIMEEVGDYIHKKLYKQAIVTIINIENDIEKEN